MAMMNPFWDSNPEVQEVFERASDVLSKDLYALTSEGHEEELNTTFNTQPIMLASCFAIWTLWQKHGGTMPEVVAGHSFGEYTALVCMGVMSFEDGIRVAAKRGMLMHTATENMNTAMAAVLNVAAESLRTLCQNAVADGQGIVEMVNFNAPSQIVIAGHLNKVEQVIDAVKASGEGKAIMLPVSVPAHSSLMKPAADEFAAFLDDITMQMPRTPVVQNIEALAFANVDAIKDALQRQLYNPVLWSDSIAHIREQYACEQWVEIGPGQVLTGISKRIDRKLACHPTHTPDKLQAAIAASA